ncbi:hypothetical protein [Miniphocaeibacter massiliensis]|uniref:hypothetical protein n=1 Tax=Miniphocaeibacter massiliensis TaxID=2041841 RepID=UPI000C1BF829|nr:hypothetical protein [Miniphocaeibacter massiliensis]
MGTIIKPGAIKNQSTSLINTLQEQNNSLNDMKASILSIQNTEGLKSDAWDLLKSQMEIGHQNVINDLIAANDSVITDSNTLIGAVGSKDLDEDEIKSKIEHLESMNNMYKSQQTNLLNQSKTNPAIASMNSTALNILDNAISKNGTEIAKYKADLQKIRQIEAATESLYQNSEGLYDNVRAGIAVLNKGRSSGFSLPMNQTEWKSAVEEEKVILKLKENGFDDQRINHMRSIGIPPKVLLVQWNTLETDEDREYYLLMATGKKENYDKAFEIKPGKLSDQLFKVVGIYGRALLNYDIKHNTVYDEELGKNVVIMEKFGVFNQALMDADTIIHSDAVNVYTYREEYYDRIIKGIKDVNKDEIDNLANLYGDIIANNGDPYSNQVFKDLLDSYDNGVALKNLLMSQNEFLIERRYREKGITYDVYPKIEDFKYIGNGVFTQGLRYTEERNFYGYWETIEKNAEIETQIQNTPTQLKDYIENRKIDKKIEEEKNLAEKYILDSFLNLAMLGADIYIGAGVTIPASVIINLASENVNPIEGLTDDSLIKSKGGRLAAGAINTAGSSLINSYRESKKLNKNIEKMLNEMWMGWIGGSGTYSYKEQLPDGTWTKRIKSENPNFMDVINVKQYFLARQWGTGGLGTWAPENVVKFLENKKAGLDTQITSKENEINKILKGRSVDELTPSEKFDYNDKDSKNKENKEYKNSIERILSGKYKEKGEEKVIFEDLDQYRKDVENVNDTLRDSKYKSLKDYWQDEYTK